MEAPNPRPRLTPHDLDSIRASINGSALFEGLGLCKAERKSKPNDWWALSPFHEEKTPSFHMKPDGVWYDFSIGKGGGPIELIEQLYNYNCYQAGQYLLDNGWAQKTAMEPDVQIKTNRVKQQVETQTKPNPEVSTTYQNKPIRQDLLPMTDYHDYLRTRGLSEETCQALGIGYLGQGRSPLRGRVIFQIRDARISKDNASKREPVILSHIGRAIGDDQNPKYLFYEGFRKSDELYGQDRIWLDPEAHEQIKATGRIVLTEGPMDVAKAYEAGLRNVVASYGASLSEVQASKLGALAGFHNCQSIRIVFDRDKAGRDGAIKAADLLKTYGLEINIFDWNSSFRNKQQPIHIPRTISDLADLSGIQIEWLRAKGLL